MNASFRNGTLATWSQRASACRLRLKVHYGWRERRCLHGWTRAARRYIRVNVTACGVAVEDDEMTLCTTWVDCKSCKRTVRFKQDIKRLEREKGSLK